MIKYRTLDDHNFSKDRVLLRLDLNLPTQNGAISDPTRLTKVIPTIARLASQGAKVIIISHLGRPKGKIVREMSMEQIFSSLCEALNGFTVKFKFLYFNISNDLYSFIFCFPCKALHAFHVVGVSTFFLMEN